MPTVDQSTPAARTKNTPNLCAPLNGCPELTDDAEVLEKIVSVTICLGCSGKRSANGNSL